MHQPFPARSKGRNRRQSGFSLVEAAVVLFVIGLLLGGVFGTRSILRAAQVNAVVTTITDLQAAIAGFKERYGYLPGDCPNTVSDCTLPISTPTGVIYALGNGDGVVCCLNNSGLPDGSTPESGFAWAQLYNTGFLTTLDTSNPNARVTTPFGAIHMTLAGQNLVTAYLAGWQNLAVVHVLVLTNLPCEIAVAVDAKLDDGDVYSGRAMGNQASGAPVGTCPEKNRPGPCPARGRAGGHKKGRNSGLSGCAAKWLTSCAWARRGGVRSVGSCA